MNKKLFLISAIACCCSLSSCDMDLTPETNIATDESVRNVGDCENTVTSSMLNGEDTSRDQSLQPNSYRADR